MLFSASGVVHGDSLKKLETIDCIYPVPGGGWARCHPPPINYASALTYHRFFAGWHLLNGKNDKC